MIWNYLKIGYRSIIKNKLHSLINIVGLGIAFGCLLVLFSFLDRTYHLDDAHENKDRIYLLESVIEHEGQKKVYGTTPFALGPSLKEDFREVEQTSRMQYTTADFRSGEKVFNEQIIFVDDGFLDIFSFPLKSGTKDALKQKDRIVLSRIVAKKYFGEEEAVGKQVSILYSINGKEYKEAYIVGAVADEFPYSTSLRFNILVPFSNRKNLGLNEDGDWANFTNATFVMLNESGSIVDISNAINEYTSIQNLANPEKKVEKFIFDPLPEMGLNSYGKEDMISYNAHPTAIFVLSIISAFILILAVFNYINISVVSSTSRLKEIGLRKTIGGSRKQIILQFINENAILCFLAFVFGWLLANSLLLPGFNSIASSSSPLIFDYQNPRLWIFISTIFFVVSIGSAAYPAFFVSGFKPINIFKGNLKLTSKNYFTKSMLSVQFIISFITISLGVVFVLNQEYIEKRDWGYDKEQTVVIPLAYNDQYSALRDALSQNPSINIITGSRNHIGYWADEDVVTFNSEQYISRKILAGYDYLDALGLRLQSGRFFRINSTSDKNESVVVNKAFVEKLGIGEPIGERIVLDSAVHYIIGIVDDFHYMHFRHEIKPILFKIVEDEFFSNLVFRTLPGEAANAEKYARNAWKELYPDNTYEGYFQNAAFDQYYRENEGITNMMIAIACIAILISCMGLFGLVSMFIAKRQKEYSIRKVMGASAKEITLLVNKGFIWIILISCLIGIPLSYMMAKGVIESIFTYHAPLNAIPYILTGSILLFTALATVSSQIFKAIRVNPVEQLRNE